MYNLESLLWIINSLFLIIKSDQETSYQFLCFQSDDPPRFRKIFLGKVISKYESYYVSCHA